MASSIVKKNKLVPINWSCQDSLNLFQRPSLPRWGPSYAPMICMHYLNNGRCDGEKNGCRRYHIERPWLWQIRKDNGAWCKFPDHLANVIENAYYDVSLGQITLPRLPRWLKEMLGNQLCIVYFKEMKIKGNNRARTYDVRRLCTPSSVINSWKYATEFEWYMLQQGVTETDWERIDAFPEVEKQYLDGPESSVTLSLNGSRFTLNFLKMSGKCLDSGKKVFIRRRPNIGKGDMLQPTEHQFTSPQAPLINATKPETDPDSIKQKSLCPLTGRNWKKPHDRKAVTRLTQTGHVSVFKPGFGNLNVTTDEPRKVSLVLLSPHNKKAVRIEEAMLSAIENAKNMKIVEVRNLNLSRPFNNKVTEIERRQRKKPLVLRLLHCPQPDQVDNICRNNFSPDLQMPGITQNIGKGTYFFESPAEAFKWCPEDAPECVLMLADVYIGDATPGNPTLSCPPKKPVSGTTFSPCVGESMKDKRGKARNDTTKSLTTANNVAEVNDSATDEDIPEASLPQVSPTDQGKSYVLKTPGSGVGERFDTLVDTMTDPGVFVKFSKREYCPKYIITFSMLDVK